MTEVQKLAKIKVLKDLYKEYVLLAKYNGGIDYDRYCALEMAIKALDKEQKKGSWIKFKEFENGYYHIKCSNCGQYWSIDGHAKCFKYCFNCGAKMEVKNETTN